MKTEHLFSKLRTGGWGILLFFCSCSLPGVESFLLWEKGSPSAVFEKTPGGEKSFAFFNETLRKMGKKPFPVVAENAVPAGKNVIRFKVKASGDPAKDDLFSITFPAKNTMEIACTDLSIQWAINYLLEKGFTVQHLYPEESGLSFREQKQYVLPREKYTFSPSFNLKRFIERSNPSWYPKGYFKDTLDANHFIPHYVMPAAKYDKELLETLNKMGAYIQYPPTRYEGKWPENVMPVLKGKKLRRPPLRTPNAFWQLCYTHPDSWEIASRNILEYLKANPGKKNISLIQNDCGGACECANCLKANHNDKNNNSQTYFRWVNEVAQRICKVYPDLIVVAAGYTLSKTPPSFKLHKNVAVMLALDFYACVDDSVKAVKKAYIDEWSKKASLLGVWDYAWGYGYVLPRVNYHVHAEMLRYLYNKNGRIYFSENECFDAKEGPKAALMSTMIRDISVDVDSFLKEWCERAVGKKAGKILLDYYLFWENFMAKGQAIRKTPFFQSAYTSVYMSWDGDLSHMYAVSSKELKKARSLMENVLRYAVTPREKIRAKLLFRHFEYMETLLKIYGAELLNPTTIPVNGKEAAAFLRDIKNLPRWIAKRNALAKEYFAEPVMGYFYRSKIYRRRIRFDRDINEIVADRIKLVLDVADDPLVRSALEDLLKLPFLSSENKALIRALATHHKTTNEISWGDMEKMPPAVHFYIHPGHRKKGSFVLSQEAAFSGKSSMKVLPGSYTLLRFNVPAQPDTYYMMTLRIRVENAKNNAVSAVFYPAIGERNQGWRMLPPRTLEEGKWHTFLSYCKTRKDSNALSGYIFLRNFPAGGKAYLDDLRILKFKK